MCAIGSNWSVVFKISTALEKTFWSGSVRGLNVFLVPGTFRFGHFFKFAVGSVAVRSGGFKFSASLGPVRSEVLKFLLVQFFPLVRAGPRVFAKHLVKFRVSPGF